MFCTAVVGSYYSLSNVTMKISEGCRSLVSRCLQVFSNNKIKWSSSCASYQACACVKGLWPLVCVRMWSTRAQEQRERGFGETALEISQACMFQIFTKNRLFILQSTFSQICVLNILFIKVFILTCD